MKNLILFLVIINNFIVIKIEAQCPFVNMVSPNGLDAGRGGIIVNPVNNKLFTAHADAQDFTDSSGCLINWNNDYQNIFLAPNNKMVAIKDSISIGVLNTPIKNYLYFLDSIGQVQHITTIPLDTIPNWNVPFWGYDIAFNTVGDLYYSAEYNGSNRIYKIKKSGEIDSTFGVNGIVLYTANYYGSNVYDNASLFGAYGILPIASDAYDNVYVGTRNINNTNSILRYNKFGKYDSAFNAKTTLMSNANKDYVQKISIDFYGNIFIVGSNGSLIKLKSNGMVDSSFGTQGLLSGLPYSKMINTFIGADNNLFMILNYQDPVYFAWKFHYKKLDNNGNTLIPLTPKIYNCSTSQPHYSDYVPVSSFIKNNGSIITQSVVLYNPYCFPQSGVKYEFDNINNFQCGNGIVQASTPSLSLSQNNICSNSYTQITVIGNLNGASCWKYSTNFDTTWHSIYNDTITVNPLVTTTYYFKGVGYCVVDGQVDSITINVLTPTSSIQNITTCNSYFFNNQTLTNSGIYYDTLQNASGCDSLVELHLTINTIVNNTITQYNDTLTSAINNATYQWLQCNPYVIIPNETNMNYVVTSNGTYAVVVLQNGCLDTSNCITVFVSNTEQQNNLIEIYPNPTCSKFKIKVVPQNLITMKRELYNSVGQLIISTKENEIDVRQLPKGIYFIKIGNQTKKVVVE